MLDELRIRGLGVIEDAVLPLGPGLTVVTGETGAGKTMVVTGLLLLFGGRADAARVRVGADQAAVDGRVVVAGDSAVAGRVRAAGGELDDDTDLLLRRVVSSSGRSRAYAGGTSVPAAVLVELGEGLFAVHGQSDQVRLVRPAAQRAALDRYAGVDTSAYALAYARWRTAQADLADRRSRSAELRREADLLAFGVAEIDRADPQPGEDDDLRTLAARLGHAEALTRAARAAHDLLRGGDVLDDTDVSSLLGRATRELTGVAGEDGELDALASRLAELGTLAEDVGAELGAYADGVDDDPARLAAVETRRGALAALVRKYADDPESGVVGVLDWAAAARERLAEIDVSDETLAGLAATVDAAAAEVRSRAEQLSTARRDAADRLATAVTAELAGLAMATARFEVAVSPRPATAGGPSLEVAGALVGLGADGADEVELLLAAHPGAPLLPVGRGASGGELSRVMLALELCLNAGTPAGGADGATDPVPTLVFDEVDAGVGGRAAVEVGGRLARLAVDRQVIVVTHLAQVAAFADRHVVVDKPVHTGTERVRGSARRARPDDPHAVTASDVRVVDGESRLVELARMLAGSDSTTAREHAAELLADAARHLSRA